jgi:hypothetical protein
VKNNSKSGYSRALNDYYYPIEFSCWNQNQSNMEKRELLPSGSKATATSMQSETYCRLGQNSSLLQWGLFSKSIWLVIWFFDLGSPLTYFMLHPEINSQQFMSSYFHLPYGPAAGWQSSDPTIGGAQETLYRRRNELFA